MLFCKIICICILALVAIDAAAIRDSNDIEMNYRLPNHTKPLAYHIKLNPHLGPDNFTFDGEVIYHIDILSSTKTLTLHTKNLIINQTATILKNVKGFHVPTIYDYNNATEILNIGFEEDLPVDNYILHLKFTGVLSDRPFGFYKSSYTDNAGNTIWFAGTNFMATYARTVFPCWDEPALKATFTVVLKHHPNYTAISSMPIFQKSEIDESDGKIWTRFEESPIMSTYLVGFLVSDLRNISNSDGTINVWSRSNLISSASFAHEVAEKAAIELKRYTNSSAQVSKIDHVALPGIFNRDVESWGLITYKETTILYDEVNSPIDTLYGIVGTIIYQSNHQWFGNIVSPSWWTNIWINAGLAEYFKYYIIDKLYEDWRAMEFLTVKTLNLMLVFDSFEHAQPLNFEPNTPEEIHAKVYSQSAITGDRKAALLLRMLSQCLSEDVFHAGLIKYLNEHKYDKAEPEDLWTALQNALDESAVNENKFKVQEVMDTWIKQKGYPLVTVTRDEHSGKVKITQKYFQPFKKMGIHKNINSTNAVNKWWIPINFATHTNPDFSSTLTTHWLSPESKELIIDGIDPQDWIIVNIQQTGFYRVNYDAMNWLKIANYLDSENYTKIHVLNRAQIVNDAINFMYSDKLDPRIFMDITKYLRRETDYVVWYTVFRVLGDAIKLFIYNGGGEFIKPYVWDLMDNIMETVGTQNRSSDDYFTKMTRYRILEGACDSDYPVCLREAHSQLINYLKNPILANRTSFHKKKWIFCNGIKHANESVWNQLFYLHTNKSESTLYCLGYSKNLTIIEKYLNMAISEDSPIAKEDIYRVFYSVLDGDFPNIDVMINFTINHWDKLTTILDDPTNLLDDINWAIVSRKQIQKMKVFLSNLGMEIPQIVKYREQNVDFAETTVNKIRSWLEHRSPNLLMNTILQ